MHVINQLFLGQTFFIDIVRCVPRAGLTWGMFSKGNSPKAGVLVTCSSYNCCRAMFDGDLVCCECNGTYSVKHFPHR
jgi:hypothetical protein